MEPDEEFDSEETEFDPDIVILIEVEGGVVDVTRCPEGSWPLVIDRDSFPDAEIDWERNVVVWGDRS